MATKALKITSAITNPTDGAATTDIVVSFAGISISQDSRGIASHCSCALNYFLTEAALDDSECVPLSWNLEDKTFTVSEAEWDSSAKSPNDTLYDKLKIELEIDHNVTILTKT